MSGDQRVQPGASGLDEQTTQRLRQERDELERRRDELAGEYRSQDTVGDSADAADVLERGDAIAAIDERIAALDELLTTGVEQSGAAQLPVGTRVSLRFDDGAEQAYVLVAIAEESSPESTVATMTTDSPLARALAGHRAGDSITYNTPDGDGARVAVLSLELPEQHS